MIGRKLGHYSIVEKLGQGGMGEVYVAEDAKLHRRVALKVLPAETAADPERQARFEREARAVAALNHPNIVTIYSVEHFAGIHFLTMELVLGRNLSELIPVDGLPLERFFEIGIPLADAVGAAHLRGITHRDLKPDNVMVTSEGRLKVLDFGLAKLQEDAAAISTAATRLSVTAEGKIMGTVSYMSPEQAEGKPVDPRSDIFSLGIVFYEMAAGSRPFGGDTPVSIIASIVKEAPREICDLRPQLPRDLGRVIHRCLAKAPELRYPTALDVRNELEKVRREVDSAVTPARRRPRAATIGWAAAAGAGALVLIVTGVFVAQHRGAGRIPSVGSTQALTREPDLEVDPAISPDGSMVAYAAGRPGKLAIRVRQMGSEATLALTDAEPGSQRLPRWSPDGAQLVYESKDGIHVIPVLGGTSRRLVPSPAQGAVASADWSPDGASIAYVEQAGNPHGRMASIYVRRLSGGEPRRIAQALEAHSLRWSPDGSRIAFVSGSWRFTFSMKELGNVDPSAIWIVPAGGGDPVRVTSDDHLALSPAWMPDGKALLFVSDRDGARDIYAIGLEGEQRPSGPPVRITTGLNAQSLDVSHDGTRLACSVFSHRANIWSLEIPGAGTVSVSEAQPVTRENQRVENMDPSRDGQWLAFDSDREGNQEIYKAPLSGGVPQRLTSHAADDYIPAWSPDGRELAFYSLRNGNRDIFVMNADGQSLSCLTTDPGTDWHPRWSPDGQAIVFDSNRSGRDEIYRIARDRTSGAWGPPERLTSEGGDSPDWSPRGDVVAYIGEPDDIRILSLPQLQSRIVLPLSDRLPAAEWIRWSRDGSVLYFSSRKAGSGGLWSVPASGGTPALRVRFDDPSLIPFGFSVDSQRFFVVINQFESDIWTVALK